MPVALDDGGRVLLTATEFNASSGPEQTNVLLTPDGLSAAPLQVAAPEPGTLAVGLLAIAGFAARCRRERSRRHSQDRNHARMNVFGTIVAAHPPCLIATNARIYEVD